MREWSDKAKFKFAKELHEGQSTIKVAPWTILRCARINRNVFLTVRTRDATGFVEISWIREVATISSASSRGHEVQRGSTGSC